MKKILFFILAGILFISLAGIISAESGKITAYVVSGQANDDDNNLIVGNDSDEHGCKASTGNSWCESKQKCLRIWEENCTSVKIMPSTASATAIARLGIKNCNANEGCTIVLKETGTGNKTKAIYEVTAKKESKLFGFIKKSMKVTAEVDAETGNVTSTKKPWWAFLAKEE